MTEKRDPELADDRDVEETDIEPVDLPDYDPTPFELPDDFEWVEVEEVDEDGSEA